MKHVKSILVNAPPDEVFAYVSDVTKTAEWGKFTTTIRKTSEGPIGIGSTYESDGKQFGKHTDTVVVTEYVPGKRFAIETKGDVGEVRNWFELEDRGGSTQLTKVLQIVKPTFTTRLAFPLLKVIGPRSLQNDLNAIKAKLEGSA